MEIRYFQIIIPLLALVFIFRQIQEHRTTRIGIYGTFLIISFWLLVIVFSLFPDFFSQLIAKVFDIKDNVNAIIFFAIGILFYFQLQLYKLLRRQDQLITDLVQKIALENPKGEKKEKGENL